MSPKPLRVRQMQPIEIGIDGDLNIVISQSFTEEDSVSIVLDPEQIDLVTDWLDDAAEEARKRREELQQ